MNLQSTGMDLMRTASPAGVMILQNFSGSPQSVAPSGEASMGWYNADGTLSSTGKFWTGLAIVSAGVCAYHGVKRHDGAVGWGLIWGLFGAALPVVGPVVAVAQGYAKPIKE